MLTTQQVRDLATNAEKTKIFSADHERTERRQAERILDLCATVRELREVLEEVHCGSLVIMTHMDRANCQCWACQLRRRIEEVLR